MAKRRSRWPLLAGSTTTGTVVGALGVTIARRLGWGGLDAPGSVAVVVVLAVVAVVGIACATFLCVTSSDQKTENAAYFLKVLRARPKDLPDLTGTRPEDGKRPQSNGDRPCEPPEDDGAEKPRVYPKPGGDGETKPGGEGTPAKPLPGNDPSPAGNDQPSKRHRPSFRTFRGGHDN